MKINNNWTLKLLYYIRVLQDEYYAKTKYPNYFNISVMGLGLIFLNFAYEHG